MLSIGEMRIPLLKTIPRGKRERIPSFVEMRMPLLKTVSQDFFLLEIWKPISVVVPDFIQDPF